MIKTKRICAAIIAFCMFLTFAAIPAFAEPVTGKCGENVTWTYDDSIKALTITGTGDMYSYTYNNRSPWDCYGDEIEKINISGTVSSIGDYAFFQLGGFTEINIPSSIKSIGDSAFYFCSSLKKIIIPDGVTNIGDNAFNGCSELADIELPNSVTHIGDNAFNSTRYYNDWWYNSKQYNVLYIGKHLIKADEQVINDGIKDGTVSEKYDIAPGTKTIADYAFNGCGNLKEITIPDSVVSIGNFSFNSCHGIKNITIPKSVTSVGNCAFQTCMDLENISVADGNTAYFDDDGVLYNKEKTEIVCFPKNKRNISFEIPNGITKIADGAFEYCDNLTNIIIPNSVKSIGNNAFDRCALLTGITIPNSVQSIGSSAFLKCSNLTDIAIPDGVQSIGEKTFFECVKLKSITIPNSVTSIGENAFKTCTQLNEINYDGNPSDWENVQGNGKGFFANKTITYCKGIKVEKLDNGNIVTEPTNTDTGKTVILALYSGGKDNNGGSLVELQQKKYSGTEITFETNKVFTYAKVMVWENFDSISPVCAVKIVK